MTFTAIPRECIKTRETKHQDEDEHEPGELIAEVHCPCCGAELRVEYGDDEGEIGVVGTPAK
jgi:hypothetical protein